MWVQTFVLTCSAFCNACSVCSHANQPDKCTQSMFHAGHVYTETWLAIQCASQCARTLPVRPTGCLLNYCGDLAVARGSQSTPWRPEPLHPTRAKHRTTPIGCHALCRRPFQKRRDAVDLLKGTNLQPMAEDLGFWAFRLENAFPSDMHNRLVTLMNQSFEPIKGFVILCTYKQIYKNKI